jgi:Polysaccharide pyruvyl transferase
VSRKKILLSTIHASDNYGSVLQAACLTRALSVHGAVEVLDHRPLMLNLGYYQDCLPYQVLRKRANPDVAAFIRKHRRMVQSQHELLRLTHRAWRTPGAERYEPYDVAVVGSDEVWSSLWGDSRQFFLADAPDSVRRIAYGVSVGRSSQIGRAEEVPSWLQRFDALLARDAKTERLCIAAGRPPDGIVCDPVLLVDPDQLIGLASDRPRPAPSYTLLYTEACRDDPRVTAGLAAIDAPSTLVSVGFPYPGAQSVIDADAQGFVRLMVDADLVVTSMFHGVVVGLALGKPLVVLDHPAKRAKIDDLLTRTGAEVTASGEGFRVIGAAPGVDGFRAESVRSLADAMEAT